MFLGCYWFFLLFVIFLSVAELKGTYSPSFFSFKNHSLVSPIQFCDFREPKSSIWLLSWNSYMSYPTVYLKCLLGCLIGCEKYIQNTTPSLSPLPQLAVSCNHLLILMRRWHEQVNGMNSYSVAHDTCVGVSNNLAISLIFPYLIHQWALLTLPTCQIQTFIFISSTSILVQDTITSHLDYAKLPNLSLCFHSCSIKIQASQTREIF